ncbi:MAG: T9SS type A sorting domain-containing protein, partial [Cytophagales bacterium]|nr:T9SS type A sorting domain-containing protein [Cytophagales bacterium]
ISNASGVTLASDQTVNGTLTLTSGNLNLGSNTLTIGSTFTPNSNFLGVISTSSLVINGTGAFGNLATTGGATLNNFTLNRGSGGSLALVSDLTVNGTFTQTNGDINLNGNTLRISGNYNRTSGNKIGSSTSSIIVDGSGTFSGTLGIVSPLNTLTINRTGSSVVTGSAFTLTNLNLLNGTFTNGGTITMASGGAVVTRNAGVLANPLAAASSYDVVYSNSSGSTVNTGPELPTNSTDLRNLTINSSDPVNLNANVTINGSLTFTTGIFNAGTNSIDLKGNLVSNNASQLASSSITFSGNTTVSGSTQVIFGGITVTGTLTPTSALQINGNLVNNGTLNAGSSTVTFGGTTAISGSSVSSFNNVVINNSSTLTAPSGNLSVAGNWTNNGTFNNNGGTITFTGTTSISGSSATNFGGITISGTLNAPSTLNVSRDFTNNGTFNSGSGTVVFNGSSTQSILGSTTTNFNNITVTNTAGPPAVRVQTNQNLAGVLTLGANSIFDADGSGNSSVFTLLSTNDATTADASIATLPSGAAVTGNVTVQRFMAIEGANSNRIYRYISSPVQAAAVSQIQNFIPVTGGFTGASSCSGCGTAQSMFAFNETLTNGNLSAGYINFPSASNAETLTAGRGYAMFVRGNIAPVSSAGNASWAVTGPINSGTINFNAFTTFTVDGWNLVGNPYPSTIDWDAAGWTRTNVNNAVHMLDNGLATPVYATYISGASTNGGTRFIPTGQAFFVRTTAGGVNFQATEAVKVAGTQTTFFRQETAQNELRLTLSKPGVRDEALIRLKSGSTENFDNNYDAMKLKNGTSANPVISLSSFSSDNKDLVINSVGTSFCSESFNARLIPLNVDGVIPGAHTLSFSQLDTFTEDLTFVLRDLFTKDSLTITPSSSSYQFSVTPDPKSYGNGRFVLACNCNGRITESKEPSIRDVRVYPNPTESIITIEMPYSENSISASVYDNLGSWVGDFKLGKAGELLTGNFDISSAANGMYFVRVSANGKMLTKKVIKK